MPEISQEIQETSENADKCINYPIGDKLSAFMRQQNEEGSINFALSGVLIFAAAKIYGRKVDYLEQEILGIAKNFEQIETKKGEEEEGEKSKETKKATRTKKYNIKDAININKTTFEEKEIVLAKKSDINKTLASPSRITRLHKMKEFFAKNKTKSGKLPIPKSMLLLNDFPVSNFGSTLIHDYDDYKDIVGSRKDFTSHSHFINGTTGELQSELNVKVNAREEIDDFIIPPATTEVIREEIPEITFPTPPLSVHSGKVTPIDEHLDLNIDEGVEVDNHLLSPIQYEFNASENIEIEPLSPPPSTPLDVSSIESSITQIRKISKEKQVSDTNMTNIFMVPLKRLKHKCVFDLPDSEFRELKRRKIDQWKSTAPAEVINSRVFKVIENKEATKSPEEENSEIRDDSGFASDITNATNDNLTLNSTISPSENSTLNDNFNITGTDSCYQSLVSGSSGESTKLNVPTFLEEYSGNNDNTEENLNLHESNDLLESEERVQLMKQSAINVAKWKEFLKPILAESEKRSKIDMHEYGLSVINKIGNVNESKTFEEITVQGQTPAYFLTMLQLINNRNIEVSFDNKTISAPTALNDIKLTLKSKVVHKEKFDEMGEQFNQAEESKKMNLLKRKAVQTSTPAKRRSFMPSEISLNFNTPNSSSIISQNETMNEEFENSNGICRILSQASSGYFSQNSTYSDF